MARPTIIASALTAILAAGACTRASPGTAMSGETATAARSPAPTSPSTRPGVPVPDSRTPLPAADSAPPGPPAAAPAEPVGAPGRVPSQSVDSTRLAELEREARALAKTTGCVRDDQCRTAPVGIRACGGPRYYLKYCRASTDSTALFRALARLDTAERAYNARYRTISTCQMTLPTRPRVVGGACR